MTEINARVGVTVHIKGYNEETKIFDMPVLDASDNPVELTGSTITFKTKGMLANSEVTTLDDGEIIVSPDDSTHLRWDLTALPKQYKKIEVTIERTDDLVIVIDGTMELKDTI